MIRPYYSDGAVTLYHGDSRELIQALGLVGEVDHLISDPPYDSKTHTGARTSKRSDDPTADAVSAIPIAFDPLDMDADLPMLLDVPRRWFVAFCTLEMLSDYRRLAGPRYIRGGFWRRADGAPQFTGDRPGQPGDGIAICHAKGRKRWNGGGRHAFYEFGVVRGLERVHPTQKPEPLMAAIIGDFTEPGDLILDPYSGGGTTLVAAKRLGRRAIGIELNERFCEATAKRLQQGALFAECADVSLFEQSEAVAR